MEPLFDERLVAAKGQKAITPDFTGRLAYEKILECSTALAV
jgi:hypothetical protein